MIFPAQSIPVRVFWRCLALAGATLCAMPTVWAAEGDSFTLSLSQSFQYDDNIYRLSDGVQPFGSEPRGDRVGLTGLRAAFDRRYSLQQIHASADVTRVRFDHWDRLDYETTGARAIWDWALGKRWSGRLRASQDETARDFADTGATGSETSISRQRTLTADANYWWHPDWSAGAGVERFSNRYSDPASGASEYDADIVEARFIYRPRSGNQIALVGRFTDGDYPNRQAGVVADDGFRQTDWRLRGHWQATGHSLITGYLGLSRRRHPNLTARDYTGPTARLEYTLTVSQKLSVTAIARREIGAREDLVDNFVVTRALSLAPAWQPLHRIGVQGRLEWRKRDFRGDPGLIAGTFPARDDVSRNANLSVVYTPVDPLRLSVSYAYLRRDSDLASEEYTARVATFSVDYTF